MSKSTKDSASAKFVAEGTNALAAAGLVASCIGAFAAWPVTLAAGAVVLTGTYLFGPEYETDAG